MLRAAFRGAACSVFIVLSTLVGAAEIVTNAKGEILYLIEFNEDVVRNESAVGEAPARSTMDPENARDKYGWHQPNVRALVKRFEGEYGVTAEGMTSYIAPTFSAYLSRDIADQMRKDSRVHELTPAYKNAIQYSSWIDFTVGNEILPWGKSAVGMADSLYTTNYVYLVDGGARIGTSNPPVIHSDLNVITPPVFPARSSGHANHVAGILGAKINNAQVQGANNGSTIISVILGGNTNDYASAFDWCLADAEQRGIYSAVNLSFVSASAPFIFGPNGSHNRYIRRMSNRLLVVQSAGNQRQAACPFVYPFTHPNDGILVVGGINASGGEAAPMYSMPLAQDELGTNHGPCVEVWAPANDIWSLWNTTTTAIGKISGTSMSAPYVAALALRYGTTASTPVQRENYIRAKLVATGANTIGNPPAPIMVPTYTKAPTFTIPSRLSVAAVEVDATLAGSNKNNVLDSLYLTGVWNAGHLPPGWIEFDLGAIKNLRAIRLVPELSPTPNTTMVHQIRVGNTTDPATVAATISGSSATLEPLVATLSTSARFVRVLTTAGSSNVAWREIEIYGY